MEKSVVYFEKPGRENTGQALEVVRRRIEEGGIRRVCVASTSGATALAARRAIPDPGIDIIGVQFQEVYWNDYEPPDPAIMEEAREAGVRFLPEEPVVRFLNDFPHESAQTARKFGQGVKVALEVSLMVAETRMADPGEPVIAIGGTQRGADSALVIHIQPNERIENLWVSEILCKPL